MKTLLALTIFLTSAICSAQTCPQRIELKPAPDNGMALEESAFVEQLEELLKKAA